jgi:hypothetical protein
MAAEKELLATIQSHFGGAISGHLCSRTSDILVAPSWSKHQRGAIRLAYPGVKALRLKSNKLKLWHGGCAQRSSQFSFMLAVFRCQA